MEYASKLIERIKADPENPRVGVLSNELLREFQLGYPIDELRLLLKSDDENLVEIAIWLVSKLGRESQPLLADVVHLLASPVKKIKFFALDSLLWTRPEDGCNLAQAFELLDDPDSGVRWKTLDLLYRLSREQLEAVYTCSRPGTTLAAAHREGVRWLLSADSLSPDKISDAVVNSDPTVRKFGVVAAARLQKQNPQPLVSASTSADGDLRDFANGLLPS